MTNIVRFYLAFFSLQIFLAYDATFSFAQVDPTKALIGTWVGQIEATLSGGNERTIIINSVKAKGEGEWVARGRYGQPDQVKEGPGGQEMSVSSKDNDIFVEFIVGSSKNPVRLKLVGDTKLDGTINLQERGQSRASDKRFKLEKVALKAGDAK